MPLQARQPSGDAPVIGASQPYRKFYWSPSWALSVPPGKWWESNLKWVTTPAGYDIVEDSCLYTGWATKN